MSNKQQNAAKKSTGEKVQEQEQPHGLTIRDVLLESIEAQKSIEKEQAKIEKIEGTVQEVRQSVAEHLMITAQPFGTDYDRFNAACKEQMQWLKSDEAGKNKVDKIPRCFVQAKSDIIGAMKEGLNPASFKNYANLKEAKVEARKGSGSGSGETVKVDTNTDLGSALQELFAVVKRIPEEYQPQAAQAIKHLSADLAVQYELEREKEQEQEQEQEAPQKEAASA